MSRFSVSSSFTLLTQTCFSSSARSFFVENQFDKIVFTQTSVKVKVCLGADRLELFLAHSLPELGERGVQLILAQEPTSIPIEYLESLSKLHLAEEKETSYNTTSELPRLQCFYLLPRLPYFLRLLVAFWKQMKEIPGSQLCYHPPRLPLCRRRHSEREKRNGFNHLSVRQE